MRPTETLSHLPAVRSLRGWREPQNAFTKVIVLYFSGHPSATVFKPISNTDR
jgi:hypothetical protein